MCLNSKIFVGVELYVRTSKSFKGGSSGWLRSTSTWTGPMPSSGSHHTTIPVCQFWTGISDTTKATKTIWRPRQHLRWKRSMLRRCWSTSVYWTQGLLMNKSSPTPNGSSWHRKCCPSWTAVTSQAKLLSLQIQFGCLVCAHWQARHMTGLVRASILGSRPWCAYRSKLALWNWALLNFFYREKKIR